MKVGDSSDSIELVHVLIFFRQFSVDMEHNNLNQYITRGVERRVIEGVRKQSEVGKFGIEASWSFAKSGVLKGLILHVRRDNT